MAVELAVERGVAPARWKWAAGDAQPTVATGYGVKDGDLGRDNLGNRYEYDAETDSWDTTEVGGARRVAGDFFPSSYTGNKSATTTVTGQSIAVASGATKLRVRNLDATNYGLVAFGTSAANAEANAANGVAVEAGAVETIGIPSNATHFAYVGNTGTVTLNIQQGT